MRSGKRDEVARKQFVENELPKKINRLKKEAEKLSQKIEIWFTDEASFRRDGTIHQGYYLRGSQPIIKESNGRFESVKLIGAVNMSEGRISLKMTAGKITTETYCDFLVKLAKRRSKHFLVIIHDNAPWHGKIKLPELLKQEGIENIGIISLPKYSPDMNPCEKLWKWLREETTHCQYHPTIKDLKAGIWKFYRRVTQIFGLKKIKRMKSEINPLKHCECL